MTEKEKKNIRTWRDSSQCVYIFVHKYKKNIWFWYV